MIIDWYIKMEKHIDYKKAALGIYQSLLKNGYKAAKMPDGKGLSHAMWLCYQIGKIIGDDTYRCAQYLGTITTILVYENYWTQEQMMENYQNYYTGYYDV